MDNERRSKSDSMEKDNIRENIVANIDYIRLSLVTEIQRILV